MRSLFKDLIPPIFLKTYRSLNPIKPGSQPSSSDNSEIWSGDYMRWQEAMAMSNGYDDKTILEKCKTALLKVKNGEAVYERDSVIFDKIQYSWPLLACLENIALKNKNQLHLVDFGGSLGTTYFQNRHFLKELSSFKWIIVEQQHFVDTGKMEFEDEFLKFKSSPQEAFETGNIHCLLLSSVLQYLPDPNQWITEFLKYAPDHIIIDRTGFVDSNRNLLTVQEVPEQIYKASYPCWFFDEKDLLKKFTATYDVVAEFDDSFTSPVSVNEYRCYWKGFYLKKK